MDNSGVPEAISFAYWNTKSAAPKRGRLIESKALDHRVVCTVPEVLFLEQPDEGDLELVKQLKGVEAIMINTQDEALLKEWKQEFPEVDVIQAIGQ